MGVLVYKTGTTGLVLKTQFFATKADQDTKDHKDHKDNHDYAL